MRKVTKKMGSIVVLGACMGLCLAASPAAAYNVYYGTMHNHSNISDGTGTPAEAYDYAQNNAGLDFLGLSDHASMISSTEWTALKSTADSYNQDNVFVTFWGFEWSSSANYGHVTVINTDDYCTSTSYTTDTFSELMAWLATRNGAAFLNHPGREDDQNREFDHFNITSSAKVVGIELFNKSDDFNTFYYNDGYQTLDGNMGYFDEALARGWNIGAAGGDDNHSATWGTATDYRMGVLATAKTRASIYEAIQAKRFFSTLDNNITLSFTIDGQEMGSTMAEGTYGAVITAGDGDAEVYSEVQLLKNGQVDQIWYPNQSDPVISFGLTTSGDDYYYVKVTQADGDEAISSPIFFTGSGAGGSTVSARVAGGNDDAEQYESGGTMYLNSSDLELVYDGSKGNQYVGMRFANLGIPQGAAITSAYIQFTVDETNTEATSLTIHGQDADNAATFSSTSYDITDRPLTTASVAWTPASWSSVGAAGPDQQTPDLKSIIQEIVDRGGWSANNGLAMIITGSGERTAESYDGSATSAPLLVVTYE